LRPQHRKLVAISGTMTSTTHSIQRGAFAFLLLASSAAAQAVQVERTQRDLNSLYSGGELMSLYTLGKLDHRRQEQVDSSSEATVSKFDLKAPGRARNEYIRGLRFLAKHDLKSAVASLQKAISIYPSYVAARSALGCAYFHLKEYDLARQEFTQAIQLDDHLSSSYLNLGRAQVALGEIPAAQASMEKASSIAPLDPHLLLALTYTQFLNHDYPDAIKTAHRAHAQSHPDTAIVHYYAAASWQALNNLRETRNELRTFLTEDPTSAFAGAARGIVEEIQVKEEQPPAPLLPMNAPVFEPSSAKSSSLGQEVLQDFREKQQIAEAESEGSTCSSCEVSAQPGPAETEISRVPPPASGVRHAEPGAWALRSTVNEVALFFSATDQGKSVTDLSQRDVTVHDDHKPPAAVLSFRSESDLPLRLGLLIDTSGSITQRFSFEQHAAVNFMDRVLTGKDDLAFVAGFSNSVVLARDFTPDLKELAHGINQLVPVGGTAIWDAVAFAAAKLAERQEGRPVARILVVISDGDDNSSNATLKQAIERAQRDEVIVYTVSTRYSDAESQRNDPTGNRAMKVLAKLTGGVAFFPGSAGHLNRSLAELQQVIRSRYLISYRPALFKPDGHYRSIAIVAEKSGHRLKVNARKGYYSDMNQRMEANPDNGMGAASSGAIEAPQE
jgi:Ca-activated chloride channel homolog